MHFSAPKQQRGRFIAECLLGIGLSLALLCPQASAHEDILLQIKEVDKQIREEGASAELLHRRAGLYLAHEEWERALVDYRRALDLDSDLASAHLGMAKGFLGKGDAERGLEEAEQFLRSSPGDAGGLLIRARARTAKGQRIEASSDYRSAVENLADPRRGVAIYFEWADSLQRPGGSGRAEALRVLDAGIRSTGGNVVLQEAAIDLEIESENFPGALSRIDSLLSGPLKENPRWLVRRAELLDAAGNTEEARRAYATALKRIQGLPARRRNVTAIRELEEKATDGIAPNEAASHSQ